LESQREKEDARLTVIEVLVSRLYAYGFLYYLHDGIRELDAVDERGHLR
jgi:hypothetical protein